VWGEACWTVRQGLVAWEGLGSCGGGCGSAAPAAAAAASGGDESAAASPPFVCVRCMERLACAVCMALPGECGALFPTAAAAEVAVRVAGMLLGGSRSMSSV